MAPRYVAESGSEPVKEKGFEGTLHCSYRFCMELDWSRATSSGWEKPWVGEGQFVAAILTLLD